MTKVCVTCKELKPVEDFSKRVKAKDGLQSRCKQCVKNYYLANMASHKERVYARKRDLREVLRAKLYELKSKPCVDCLKSFHPEAMEYDHCSGEKLENISKLIQDVAAWTKIEKEISKCELVCANCHRLRTAYRAGRLTEEDLLVWRSK